MLSRICPASFPFRVCYTPGHGAVCMAGNSGAPPYACLLCGVPAVSGRLPDAN
jgi:hypothetical protein